MCLVDSDTLWSRVRASLPWAVVLSIQDLRSLGLGLVDAAALFTKTHARGVRGGIGAIAAAAQKLHGAMTEHEKRRVRIPRGINIFQVPAHTEAGEPLHGDVQRALFPIQQTQINGGRLGLTALEERLCRAWLDQNGRSDKDAIVPLEHLNAIRARARELEAGAQTGDGY